MTEREKRKRKKQRKRERPRACLVKGLLHEVRWSPDVAWVLACNGELPMAGAEYEAFTSRTILTCLQCIAKRLQ